jgi:hypothetical protein
MKSDLRKKLFIIFFGSILFLFSASYAAVWDWEDGTLQGWKAKDNFSTVGDTLGLSNSIERAYHGTHSLKWHIQGTTVESYWYATVSNPRLNPGEVIIYHIWVPGGTEVRGLKTFLKDNNGNWVDGNWYDQWNGMVRNAWNELTITIPQTGAFPMLEVGLQVAAATQTVDVIVYLDYVVCGLPNPPTGLTAAPLSLSEIALDWNDNTETNFAYYKIYRDTSAGFPINSTTFVDTTSKSEFIDTGLSTYTQYYYTITAVDTDGDESLPSVQASATTSQLGAPPIIGIKQVNSITVGLYEKFEAILDLKNADYTNPYDPEEIDVQATFTSPAGKQLRIFGFFDDYNDVAQWKVRFAPNEIGQWGYSIQATDKDGTGTSEAFQFDAIESEHHGWIKTSPYNPHYLMHDDGTSFYGVGVAYPWQVNDGSTGLAQLQANGANMFYYWNSTYDMGFGLIESVNSGLGRYDQPKCNRIDRILEWSEARRLTMMLSIWPHDYLDASVWQKQWGQNPYNQITSAVGFYGSEAAWLYQEKQYRYIIARWGHSRSMGIWELVCEINGTDGWAFGNRDDVLKWVESANDFLKQNDPYGRPTTVSQSGGLYWSAGYKIVDLPNVHLYETSWTPHYSNDPLRSSLWIYGYVAQQFWRDFEKAGIYGEAGYLNNYGNFSAGSADYIKMYHNALWATWSNGLAATPLWWDFDTKSIFTADLMAQLLAFSKIVHGIDYAHISFNPVPVTVSDCDAYAMARDSVAFGWIRDIKGVNVSGKLLILKGLVNAPYSVKWLNPWNGEWFDSRIATASDGQLMEKIPKLDMAVPDVAFYIQSAMGGVTPVKLQLTAFVEQLHNSTESRAEIISYLVDEKGLLCNNSTNTISFELQGPGQLSQNEISAVNGVAKIEYQASTEIGVARIIASSPGILPDTIAIEITYPSAVDDFSTATIPSDCSLSQNYPNPFNNATMISYALPRPGHVRVAVYNIQGQLVEILVDTKQDAGIYRIQWNTKNIGSGIYFYQMETQDIVLVKKCIVLR